MENRVFSVEQPTLFIDGWTGKPIYDTGESGGFTEDQIRERMALSAVDRMEKAVGGESGKRLFFDVYTAEGEGPLTDAVVKVKDNLGNTFFAAKEEHYMIAVVPDQATRVTVSATRGEMASESVIRDLDESLEFSLCLEVPGEAE